MTHERVTGKLGDWPKRGVLSKSNQIMKPISRRELIARTFFSTAGMALVSKARGQPSRPAHPPLPRPCSPASWKKHGIVLEGVEPWEGDRIQNFTSPAEPLEGGRWRIWYSGRGGKEGFTIGCAEGRLGGPMRKVRMQCSPGEAPDAPLAVGHLPEGWRPTQVVHIHLRNGKHRVYFWAHGPRILRHLVADSEDGRRYRVIDPHRPVLYHPADRAAQGIPSPDGTLLPTKRKMERPANEPAAPSQLISNDSTFVYQLSDGSFEMYSVALVPVPKNDPAYIAHDNAPGFVRVIDRYRSEDGITFTDRRRVVQRDAGDPADMQFYHLSVTHTPEGRMGMLGHYRVEAQTMDLEWCFSRDGLQWERPTRRAWLPRGDETQPDSYGIYPPASLVHSGGKWHLFYTGVNSAHNHKHSYGPPRSVIMYASTDSIWA